MRTTPLLAIVAAVLLSAPIVSAEPALPLTTDGAGVPCGPIYGFMTVVLGKSKEIRFGDSKVFETSGTLSYYFDVDQEGYWYDGNKEIWATFAVSKQPPWLQASIDPPKVQVKYRPWECPSCLQPEGSDPGNLMFYWETPVKVKVDKLRDYTPQELKKWLRSDGTYRLTFTVSSTDSPVPINNGAGLQEGYAPKDLKFRPEIEDQAKSQASDNRVYAPGLGAGLAALAAVAAAVVASRRR